MWVAALADALVALMALPFALQPPPSRGRALPPTAAACAIDAAISAQDTTALFAATPSAARIVAATFALSANADPIRLSGSLRFGWEIAARERAEIGEGGPVWEEAQEAAGKALGGTDRARVMAALRAIDWDEAKGIKGRRSHEQGC
jgi:hypothetical protein